jgi:hypothetical protein
MKTVLLSVLIVLSGIIGISSPLLGEVKNREPVSFQMLTGKVPGWKMKLNHLTESFAHGGTVFRARISQGRTIGFEGDRIKNEDLNPLGPLAKSHLSHLSALLNHTLIVSGTDRKDIRAINLNWELYPGKILSWAKIWQKSDLYREWQKLKDPKRYNLLVDLISSEIERDMNTVIHSLGFTIMGISMEKIFHFKASKLAYYHELLKPAGISPDLTIPVPMMLWLRVNALERQPSRTENITEPYSFKLESMSATATIGKTNIYGSFNRELDRYEISSDRLEEDGRYKRLDIMTDPQVSGAARKMLDACIKLSGEDDRSRLFLSTDLRLFPDLFTHIVKKAAAAFPPDNIKAVKRDHVPQLDFYPYKPARDKGFNQRVDPFLNDLGYRFSRFLISYGKGWKAKDDRSWETILKPLGVSPDDKPILPSNVYMVIEKL